MINRTLFMLLFCINFMITLGFGVVDVFFSVYIYELGAQGALLALSVISYSGAKIILSPLMGRFADRFGAANLIVVSLFCYLLVAAVYWSASGMTYLLLARVLQGVACAIFRPTLTMLIAGCSFQSTRSSVMGSFDISFYSALAIGPILGGILKDAYGVEIIFSSLISMSAVALFGALLCQKRWMPSTPVNVENQRYVMAEIAQSSPLRGLLIFIFGRTCAIAVCTAFLPILLVEQHQLSATQLGIVMACGGVMMTLLLRPMGKLADKCSRYGLIALGSFISSFIYLLLPLTHTFIQILFAMTAIGFFSALSQPACTAVLVTEGEKFGIGATVGVFNTVLNLGFVIGPIIAGFVFNMFGLASVFYLVGSIGLLSSLLLAIQFYFPDALSLVNAEVVND